MKLLKLLKDETYINLWRRIGAKTQGYRVVITFVAILIIVGLAIVAVNRPAWPGWTGLNGKTAWDLASLLIVPLVLAVIAYFFNKRQKESELEIARKEREQEREIAQDRTQETALQNYLDKMTKLLLPPNNLRESDKDSEVRSIARAQTLTVLSGLDGVRKGVLLRFLHEAALIRKPATVILEQADLSGANLREAYLWNDDLTSTNLRQADLNGAKLSGTDLSNADLSGADLRGAWPPSAILRQAVLVKTNLGGIDLSGIDLSNADLRRADLSKADLSWANLKGASLEGTTLEGATYNAGTKWPDGFDPDMAGAVYVNE